MLGGTAAAGAFSTTTPPPWITCRAFSCLLRTSISNGGLPADKVGRHCAGPERSGPVAVRPREPGRREVSLRCRPLHQVHYRDQAVHRVLGTRRQNRESHAAAA